MVKVESVFTTSFCAVSIFVFSCNNFLWPLTVTLYPVMLTARAQVGLGRARPSIR